jgi:hypothetical protein
MKGKCRRREEEGKEGEALFVHFEDVVKKTSSNGSLTTLEERQG